MNSHDHIPAHDDDNGAVIVSIRGGHSYDRIFEMVPQRGASVFLVDYRRVPNLLWCLRDARPSHTLRKLVCAVKNAVPSSVVFNFECCSSCAVNHFPHQDMVLAVLRWLLKKGHMAMVSDFTLKALLVGMTTIRSVQIRLSSSQNLAGLMNCDLIRSST